jgi:hypothetical protein
MAARLGLVLAMLVLCWPMGAAADDHTPVAPRGVSRAWLDLRAPPLNHVVSPRQMAALSADPAETSADDVTIRADHSTPACCGTLVALPWAFFHPQHAWQIFTPVVGTCPGMWCTAKGN